MNYVKYFGAMPYLNKINCLKINLINLAKPLIRIPGASYYLQLPKPNE